MAENLDLSLKGPFIIIHRGGGIPVPFPFLMPPQHVETTMAPRVAVHQTLEDNFVDDFSGPRSMPVTVTMRGTFGYNRMGFGSLTLLVFEKILEGYNALSRETKATAKARQEFIGLSRLYFWRIVIDQFSWQIDHANPLLYFYTLRFRRLQDYLSLTDPQLPERTGPADATGLRAIF